VVPELHQRESEGIHQEQRERRTSGAGLLTIHPFIDVPLGSFLFQESLVRLAIGRGSVFGIRDRPPPSLHDGVR
jgi:hypothetical protein